MLPTAMRFVLPLLSRTTRSRILSSSTVMCANLHKIRCVCTLEKIALCSNSSPRTLISRLNTDSQVSMQFTKYLHTSSQKNSEILHEPKSKDGVLIYAGDLSITLKLFQGGLYVISAGIILTSPHLFHKTSHSMILTGFIGMYVFLFAVVNPASFYVFSRRYVHKLFYDENTDVYTALVTTPFVKGYHRIRFSPEECKMPSTMTLFTSFYVRNKPLFINSDEMNYDAYARMLRFASDYDYENPKRQKNYDDLSKDDNSNSKKNK